MSTDKVPIEHALIVEKNSGICYTLLHKAMETSNGREGLIYAIYTDGEKDYVCEWDEFWSRFERISLNNISVNLEERDNYYD